MEKPKMSRRSFLEGALAVGAAASLEPLPADAQEDVEGHKFFVYKAFTEEFSQEHGLCGITARGLELGDAVSLKVDLQPSNVMERDAASIDVVVDEQYDQSGEQISYEEFVPLLIGGIQAQYGLQTMDEVREKFNCPVS